MRGLWLENQKLTFRDDIPNVEDKPGEAIIRVLLAGICSTDLELVRGYYPYWGVPGHEFVGIVEEAADQPDLVGKRVVGEINAACGICEMCQRNLPTHCFNRTVLGILNRDGVFAEYCRLPIANLHVLPESVPNEVAVFTEPLAAALEIFEQVHIPPTASMVLVGAGRLGQLIARVAVQLGINLSVIARREKHQKLLEQKGIKVIASSDVQSQSFDYAIDATGSPDGLAISRKVLRPRGVLILKSTYAGNLNINMSGFVVDELTVIGSRCGPFEPAIRMLQNQLIDPTDLIEDILPLERSIEGFTRAAQPGVLKVLLRCSNQ